LKKGGIWRSYDEKEKYQKKRKGKRIEKKEASRPR
jgi:hypothetical protein